MITFVVLKNIS